MLTCTFFGHGDTPWDIYPLVKNTVERLITEQDISQFLVGTHGAFDTMALRALRKLKKQYPHISYSVVLAYMPGKQQENPLYTPEETMLPEGVETAPRRFAISWRNKWMVRQAELVVCYISRGWGGAAQFVKYAENKGKRIINLYGM